MRNSGIFVLIKSLFWCVLGWRRFAIERRYWSTTIAWLEEQPKFLRNAIAMENLYQEKFHDKVVALLPDQTLGPYVQYSEYFLRYCRINRINLDRDVVFLGHVSAINQQFQVMLDRLVNVVYDDSLHKIVKEGGYRYLMKIDRYIPDRAPEDLKNGVIYYPNCPVNFRFTLNEVERGWSLLREIGISRQTRFVAVHNKDQQYEADIRGEIRLEDRYRDTDFNDLGRAIDYLIEQEYIVVRAGYHANVQDEKYRSILSFQENDRSFLDLFIQKYCCFSICGDSGIAHLPWLFKTPTLYHNFIPMDESPVVEAGIIIPKLMRWKSSGKLATIREIRNCRQRTFYHERGVLKERKISADSFQTQHLYDKVGLEIIDNTPEEVLQGTFEIVQLAQKKLVLTEAEEKEQRRMKSLFPVHHPMRHTSGIFSPYWLNKHNSILS